MHKEEHKLVRPNELKRLADSRDTSLCKRQQHQYHRVADAVNEKSSLDDTRQEDEKPVRKGRN